MADEVIQFDWETVVRPPFGVWHRISDDLEVRVLGTDAPGTLRVRRAAPTEARSCICPVDPDGPDRGDPLSRYPVHGWVQAVTTDES